MWHFLLGWSIVAILAAVIWIAVAALNRRWNRMEREARARTDWWCGCAECRAVVANEQDHVA